MQIGSVIQSITHTASGEEVNISPAVGTIVNQQFVENLPLNEPRHRRPHHCPEQLPSSKTPGILFLLFWHNLIRRLAYIHRKSTFNANPIHLPNTQA
jgi:hypothetical protein